MRKTATLLVIGLLLMTSLMAFAGGSDENFVHTLPEEFVELPVEVPSGGVTPRIDCDHTYGTRTENTDCSDNHHIGEWEESSAFLNDAGRWIVEFYCSHCNEYGGWRYL